MPQPYNLYLWKTGTETCFFHINFLISGDVGRIRKSWATGWWFTDSSCVIPTSCMVYQPLYNNPSYSCILIGSCLWSVREQTYDWCHHYRVFASCIKMVKSFENLDNILQGGAKDKVQKSLAEASNRFKKQEEER